jgi:hypothetical protein
MAYSIHSRLVFVSVLGVSACGVSDTDSSLWAQTKDLGGTQFDPTQHQGPGAAGMQAMGAGGDTNPNLGQGGTPPGSGNAPPVGAGGSTFMGGTGGSTELPPGSGGFVTGSGGSFVGMGGMNVGSGGFNVGAGGASPGTGGMQVTGNSGKCTFSFDVTTVTARGRYAPANVGAIWISDASSKFVKTLRIWGTIRLSNATAWTQATSSNRTDAVTGATRPSHGALNAKWDCTDTSKNAVPDGNYVVHVTFTESDANPFFGGGTPIQASVNFTKAAAGADVPGTDTANFTGMHVKLTVP